MGDQVYALGVDGGATKTVAVIGDQSGRSLGYGSAGPSNYHNVGGVSSLRAIRSAVAIAKRNAGLSNEFPKVAVVALAGVDSVADSLVANRFVKKARIARSTFVVHDSIAALYAATQGKPGIVVNSGTGSVAAGFNSAGRYARAGGYGYLIADEGSAFDVGRRSLATAFRSLDGRAPPTKLTAILKRVYGVRHLEDILNKIYSERLQIDSIARLAPLVAKEAPRDRACIEILRQSGISLAELVCAVAKKLNMEDSHLMVVTFGGNFKVGPKMVGPFKSAVKRKCKHVKFAQLKDEPALGAYALAASMLRGKRLGSKNFLVAR